MQCLTIIFLLHSVNMLSHRKSRKILWFCFLYGEDVSHLFPSISDMAHCFSQSTICYTALELLWLTYCRECADILALQQKCIYYYIRQQYYIHAWKAMHGKLLIIIRCASSMPSSPLGEGELASELKFKGYVTSKMGRWGKSKTKPCQIVNILSVCKLAPLIFTYNQLSSTF